MYRFFINSLKNGQKHIGVKCKNLIQNEFDLLPYFMKLLNYNLN